MNGYKDNIEKLTLENTAFRRVLFTAAYSQLVLMSLRPGEEIGLEVHTVDQFFRFESGQGKAILDKQEFLVSDGDAVIVPAGVHHNISNTSQTDDLKLYTIYSPPQHQDGTIHLTKAEAEAAEAAEHNKL